MCKYIYIYIYSYTYIVIKLYRRNVAAAPGACGLFVCSLSPMHTGSALGAHGASHRRTTNCMKKRRVTVPLMSAAYP